ncbi:hypothetical protein Cgig2_018015 [Carnegiea gigantea]|uniref:Uncharacterized protein n=1 Tax=Carnegiea gigantea TaxID=171969 RepID=A0A9Q1GPB3_9CARY|nr:hypothetical protein Cgig2_018015 [Carnegiea gigantea]
MFRGVKEIRKRLDDIANDHTKFGFKFESKPILRRREETCSYVYAQDVTGREDDIDKIMRKLLDPDVKRDVSCLAIVGMGGLGKTALAQLVYNHPRIEENFPSRLWTCVSDQDEKTLDIRTCLRTGYGEQCIPVDKLLRNWMSLRALDLSNSRIKSLPSALGKLQHLRYLDLSRNSELEILPNSVTKLHNLQTLILEGCHRLRELPESLPELVKLRVLDMGINVYLCNINSMPQGIGKLSCLQQLPLFVVGDNNSTSKQSIVDQMEELKALTDLKGSLRIKIVKNTGYIVENAGERGYIRNKPHLSHVRIVFPGDAEERNGMRDNEEGLLLEDLQPHPKLRELELWGYMGSRMPSWAGEDNLAISLPNLVKASFTGCFALQHLPSLRKFRDLKFLRLSFLDNLEYVENTTRRANISDGAGTSEPDTFFPSLERLWLSYLPKLKGWWIDEEINNTYGKHGHRLLPSFPHLIRLTIHSCPNLTCFPPCPTVEELDLLGEINENLRIMTTSESGNSKLRCVHIDDTCLKTILPIAGFQCLQEMRIYSDGSTGSVPGLGEALKSSPSPLKHLSISSCCKLKCIATAREFAEGNEIRGIPRINAQFNGRLP